METHNKNRFDCPLAIIQTSIHFSRESEGKDAGLCDHKKVAFIFYKKLRKNNVKNSGVSADCNAQGLLFDG